MRNARLTLALAGVVSGLLAAVAAVAPVQAGLTRVSAAEVPPNVVVVLLDDARYDDIASMPLVQRQVGQAGATLTRFYSSMPLCCPARASLLTGQYPHNHKVLSNKAPTGGFKEFDDRSTLATWLDPTYRTGLVGKYLNEYEPPYQPPGWDEWLVPRAMYNYTATGWFLDKGQGGAYATVPGYQTDAIGALAADFIRRNAPASQPFFLQTSLVAPHAGIPADPDDPDGVPTPYVEPAYRDFFEGSRNTDPSFDEADVSDKPLRPAPLSDAEERALNEALQQRREAGLSAQDAILKVLGALRDAGELNDTYVFVLSDNGYILGEHRIRGGKVAPYEVSARVPLMVRGPGIPAGATVEELSGLVDLAPTILSMTGVDSPTPGRIDGVDLLPVLRDPTRSLGRPGILLEATKVDATTDPLPWSYHAIVSGDYKYVERTGGNKELYNLAWDPYELKNIAGQSAYALTQSRLATMLEDRQWCTGADCR